MTSRVLLTADSPHADRATPDRLDGSPGIFREGLAEFENMYSHGVFPLLPGSCSLNAQF